MEEKQILNLFYSRDERAIIQTKEKYGSYCAAVAGKILDSREDVEEVLCDTWLQAWNSIPPQQPASLKLYLARITRNLAFDKFRGMHRDKRGGGEIAVSLDELSECIPSPAQPGDALDGKELQTAINRFLSILPTRDRSLFLRRYFYVETTEEIARRYGMKEGNVRTILSRTRKKMKTYLLKEGFDV